MAYFFIVIQSTIMCLLRTVFITFLCFFNNKLFWAYASLHRSNETDLSKCQIYYSRSGSSYKDFFSISDLTTQHLTSDDNNETEYLLDFHFSVLAASDAHILLAPSDTLTKEDPAYEIVIGAGGNTFCDIRRKQKSEVKASVREKKLLSSTDPRSFWLHISKDGVIELGKEGEELSFISWIDPDPLPLKVFSFSTWEGIEAKWYFDCDQSGTIEEIEKRLTNIEKLRRDLLSHYDPYVRPVMNLSTITTVYLTLQTHYLNLDEFKSVLQVSGVTKLAWHDEKLRWDPDDYGGIDNVHILRREIWQPDLMLYNAIGNGRNILQDSMMVAQADGNVQWTPPIKTESWCDMKNLNKWPSDTHTCQLTLAFVKDFDRIQIEFNKNDSSLTYHESLEWIVQQADIFTDIQFNETFAPPLFDIVLTLKRNSTSYNAIFFTPFLVIGVSLLITFWMDPLSPLKIAVCSTQVVMATIMILALAMFSPCSTRYLPYLVQLYSYTLVATLIAIILAILVINFSRNKQMRELPHFMTTLLASSDMQKVFYLPQFDMPHKYGEINSTNMSEGRQKMWILLGVLVDRVAFLVYLSLFIYAVVLNVLS